MTYTDLFQKQMAEIICDVQGNEVAYESMIDTLVRKFRQIRRERGVAYFIGNGGSAGIAIKSTLDVDGCQSGFGGDMLEKNIGCGIYIVSPYKGCRELWNLYPLCDTIPYPIE